MQKLQIATVVLALLSAGVYSQSLTLNTTLITIIPPVVITTRIPVPSVSIAIPPPPPGKIFVTNPTCPASNGSYYLSAFNSEFRIGCPFGNDRAKRQDIVDAYISRFADCIEVCDPTTPCLGMLFNPKTLACAGYKCQPDPLDNQWAAGVTAMGGVAVDPVSCGKDQNSQLIFNVENALLNQATISTTTVAATTVTAETSVASSVPPGSSESSTSTSVVTSVALTTVNTSSSSRTSASAATTYTPAVVQTNAANPAVIPQLLAGIAAVFPLFGF